MSEQNANPNPPADPRAVLGQHFRSARMALHLSRDDLAQRLRLRPDIVDALEKGDYAPLGAPVFVRGYLRSYAAAVQVDTAELQVVTASLGDAPKIGPSPIAVRRNPWIERYSLAGTYLVGTVLVMWILWSAVQTGLVARLAEPTLPLPEPEVALMPLPITPAVTDVAAADGFEEDAQDSQAASDAVLPDEAVRQGPVMASMVPSLDRGEARFAIRVADDTWLEIRDASGKRIQYDIQRAGEKEYRGKPPFELRIGNAARAEVLVDGRSLDLAPYSRREIARLRLIADGSTLRAEALPRAAESRSTEAGSTER
ncbi:MAG: DUF4115 domain-containing protein [Xanthomonadales bacterium]|jgi:cytoskeleton protein RodZ|nr:DUF4115 domain-containing protein [Xanthomonadales bacterium]